MTTGFTGHETATTVTADRVTYHQTEVVDVSNLPWVTLRTGGWKSVTTKRRMNQAAEHFSLPFRVFQSDHHWFIELLGLSTIPFDGDSITFNIKTGATNAPV